MGTKILAPRSGEMMELIYITILLTYYCVLCLIYLSLFRAITFLVYHTAYVCPCHIMNGGAIYTPRIPIETKRRKMKNPIDGSIPSQARVF